MLTHALFSFKKAAIVANSCLFVCLFSNGPVNEKLYLERKNIFTIFVIFKYLIFFIFLFFFLSVNNSLGKFVCVL